VQGVSFPRSGHGLLQEFLQGYFGTAFRYCEFYGDCGARPCTNPDNHFQKNHDFDLLLPPGDAEHHVVQFRHPLYSIPSHYELFVHRAEARGAPVEDSFETWRGFAGGQIRHWKAWIQKWVLSGSVPDALILPYEDVVREARGPLGASVRFWLPSRPVDRARVDALVEESSLEPRRDLSKFRYFDAAFFGELEGLVGDELGALGYPPVMRRSGRPPSLPPRAASKRAPRCARG
jgi:hypothetical protein